MLRFEAALSELLPMYADRWAVWLDGLRSTHATHEGAHDWAAKHLPAESAFVVARVEPRKPVNLSAARWRL